MPKTLVAYVVIAGTILMNIAVEAANNDVVAAQQDSDDVAGIYRVLRASLSVNDCEKTGIAVEYASQFIRFSPQQEGYRSEVCDGEDLDELDCNTSHSVIRMDEQTKSGWQGFRYSARPGRAADGTPTCLLVSARRRINMLGNGVLHYERSDWSELVSDFQWECERDMARQYAEAQSLKCNTHIVLELQKEAPVESPVVETPVIPVVETPIIKEP